MTEPEYVFHKTLGCYIANSLALEYNGYMEVVYDEAKLNHLRNKCRVAMKAEQAVLDNMKIKLKAISDQADEIIQFNSKLIFDITALPEEKQRRVYKLVQKLEKEEDEKSTTTI